MKKTQKFLQAASERFDVPGDIMAGLPKLELTGFSKLSLAHHKGILEYTQEVVTVALSIGNVRISGKNLSISLMNHEYVIVSGEISNLELHTGAADE